MLSASTCKHGVRLKALPREQDQLSWQKIAL